MFAEELPLQKAPNVVRGAQTVIIQFIPFVGFVVHWKMN